MNRPRAGSIGAQGLGQQQQQQQQQYSQQQYVPPQNQQASPQRQQRSGPRANCDQVVFEAIAKAAEIVVASRCNIESDPSSASQTGSGRFNLLVPEVKSVRNILQRWKRTMHVPLRLDVYYQHPPKANNEAGERELLERWCLEYAPTTSQSHATGIYDEQYIVDPIVQLRKVCKNIVVWLRTLYCHSRLLPAQALRKNQSTSSNNCIGFSIYVVGEGQDDVSGLLQSGFDSEPKPSGEGSTGVPTPYGVLGWRVYLAPRDLVRRLLAIEAEKARVLQQQYANTSSLPRSIPMKVVQPPNQSGYGTNSGGAQPVARSAPTHNRGYRRSNSDSVAAHSPSQQLFQQHQQHQQEAPDQTRYYSRSPGGRNSASPSSTLLAPRSYHHQGGLLRRNSDVTNNQRGLYPIESSGNLASHNNNDSNTDSPSSGASRSGAGGINPNKNLSALSLALLSMKTDTDSSSPDPSESDNAATTAAAELGPSEIRRAALHNAPPSSGVGEYGYAYNTSTTPTNTQQQQQQQQQQQHQGIHPNLSSSPASVNPHLFKGPSTPASSTFGTTPPGYLLSATPSVGSHGTMNLATTPGLVPPARPASNSVAPPFVRPLGFAGQAAAASASTTTTTTTSQPLPQAAEFQQQLQFQSPPPPPQLGGIASTPEDQKPSLDLLHSSPFHHSAMGMHNGSSNQPSSTQKDGLASFLQAEENASMEAATTFINDFYHHHYPMASLTDSPHHHHNMASASEDYHHSSGLFAEHASSILDPHELHQAEDMPFAVEGISSGLTPTSASAASTSLLKHNMSSTHEASLMAASMMVPHKKLALFGSTTEQHPNDTAAAGAGAATATNPSEADDIDALTDQLADFRSFGATLASPLTTSVGSGG